MKTVFEKNREDVFGGPSMNCIRKAVVVETSVLKCTFMGKSIVGIDASQLHPNSMCQPMPTSLYTHWEFVSEKVRFTPLQNKARNFEYKFTSHFQRSNPETKIESSSNKSRQNDVSADGSCSLWNTLSETLGCFFFTFVPVKK